MGLLLLLSSMLLSSYFQPGRVVNAQQPFTIRHIDLSIEPSTNVTRDTNVTLICSPLISSTGQEALSREYTIYKDGNEIYKSSSTLDKLVYQLPMAKVSNTGKYHCTVNIKGKRESSEVQKLTVTGLSKPLLHSDNSAINEGEKLTVRCTAPDETGSTFFFFFFKEGYKDILEMEVKSNQAVANLSFSRAGSHIIYCSYKVPVRADISESVKSDNISVLVKELQISAVLDIVPQNKVYEGDPLDISCTTSNMKGSENINLHLSQGTELLGFGNTTVRYLKMANAEEPGEFECSLQIGKVRKVTTKTVSVTELFSVPTLTMSPPEVFQMEHMSLTCKSQIKASEKINENHLTYTLDPPLKGMTYIGNGVFSGKAPQNDFNYTCITKAKSIMKHSKTLTIRPKVAVSAPRISVVDRAVLRQPFKILCQSDNGSLPINYTLLKNGNPLHTISVKLSIQQALFTAKVMKTDEINEYRCMAKNSRKEPQFSERLNTAVIEPVMNPLLTVIPPSPEIFEGNELYLICGTTGTPPVTFKLYRVGNQQPLYTTTTNTNNTDYQVSSVSKEHSGTYYCEAFNHANIVVRSNQVVVEVRMALWKKAIIGGICLLVVSVVVCCVLYFKCKRVKMDRATVSVWSRRPPEADAVNDEESSVGSNEPDVEYTEVVHPQPVDPARVPLRKGTDTVYSELQNSPHGAADHHGYGSVEYAELNSDQPEISHYRPEVNSNQDLPVPVD